MTVTTTQHVIRENLLRSRLRRRGLVLMKSRRHNRDSADGCAYFVAEPRWSLRVYGDRFGASLDAIDEWLTTLEESERMRGLPTTRSGR